MSSPVHSSPRLRSTASKTDSPNQRPRSESVSSENELKAELSELFTEALPQGVQLNKGTFDILSRMAQKKAMTFDEITLSDRPVDFHPNDVVLKSFVTRNISLKGCGIMSAAMDTVTEKETALAMAKMGGMGVIHRYMPAQEQANQVKWVRRKIHYGGMIDKPITFLNTDYFSTFERQCAAQGWHFTSFPVVDKDGKFMGLVTKETLEFVDPQSNPQLGDVMLGMHQITVVSSSVNTEEAYQLMRLNKVKKLPVVDAEGCLFGMYVWNDVNSDQRKREKFSLDIDGHFLVAAAIGTEASEMSRAKLLVEAGCRIIVIEAMTGATEGLKKQIVALRETFKNSIDIIAGNISSYTSAKHLLQGEGKPDAIKVGVGGGSTANTRNLTGHGTPQITALFEVWKAIHDHGNETGYFVPVIADGGIRTSGDIVKCLAVGASAIMLGSLMAGTTEAPGLIVEKSGRKYKTIRGVSSRHAVSSSCGEEGPATKKAAVELSYGVQGRVLLTGSVEKLMTQLLGGIQSGLAHSGAKTIPELQQGANIWVQSFAGVAEGRPHDITDIRG